MDEITLSNASLTLLRKDLGLEEADITEVQDRGFERLAEWLHSRVKHMLDHDFASLLNALYRVDLPEEDLKRMLHETPPDRLSRTITEAILAREREKVITRHRYRTH